MHRKIKIIGPSEDVKITRDKAQFFAKLNGVITDIGNTGKSCS
jgi:hypothetical protein